MNFLSIDGSVGEGGGQILRSSLSLSMLKGQPIHIRKIRAGRSKPGLMRQHLVCVEAARALCGAVVEGANLGSTELRFTPGALIPGDYNFAIGSAGSTTLVLQTVLPAMLAMSMPCSLSLTGGTHNPLAPSADFFSDCFMPQLHAMGANVQFELRQLGLFPAGGGQVKLCTQPQLSRRSGDTADERQTGLAHLRLMQRIGSPRMSAHAIVAGVPEHVAQRELNWLRENDTGKLRLPFSSMRSSAGIQTEHTGPGNVLGLSVHFDNVSAHVTEFGTRAKSAEDVAKSARDGIARYLRSGAVVCEHLADQLLLPMLIAGGGEFVTGEPSAHLRTNASVIEAFGVAKISIDALGEGLWRVGLLSATAATPNPHQCYQSTAI